MAEATVDFMGRRLAYQEYRLHDAVRRRRRAERDEAVTRHAIDCLRARIRREINANPAAFPHYWEDSG